MPKGISPIISVVMLMLIVIVLVGVAFLFFTKVFQTASKPSEEQTQHMTEQGRMIFTIDNIDTNNDVVYLRNAGSAPLSNLSVYVNNIPTNATFEAIQPGAVGAVQLATPFQEGTNKIKIASTGLFYLEESVTVPARWVVEFPTDTSQTCQQDYCLEVSV